MVRVHLKEDSAIRAPTANFSRRCALSRAGKPVNEQDPWTLYHPVLHNAGSVPGGFRMKNVARRATRPSKEKPESITMEEKPALFPERARTIAMTRAEMAAAVASKKE